MTGCSAYFLFCCHPKEQTRRINFYVFYFWGVCSFCSLFAHEFGKGVDLQKEKPLIGVGLCPAGTEQAAITHHEGSFDLPAFSAISGIDVISSPSISSYGLTEDIVQPDFDRRHPAVENVVFLFEKDIIQTYDRKIGEKKHIKQYCHCITAGYSTIPISFISWEDNIKMVTFHGSLCMDVIVSVSRILRRQDYTQGGKCN